MSWYIKSLIIAGAMLKIIWATLTQMESGVVTMYHLGQRLRNFTEVIRALYAHVYITLTYNRQAVISFTYKSNI